MSVETNGKRSLRRWAQVTALAALAAVTSPARAQQPDAEALFREGRDLMAAGRIAEACTKLERSEALEPSPGTLMNLAYCHAQLGKTASAWLEFLRAERQAIARRQPERAREARRQAVALEPVLSHLTIRVPPLPGLVVRLGERTLAPAALGTPLPVDPGRHVVHISAPGHRAWSAVVDIVEAGERRVEAPALAEEPRATVRATRPPAPRLERRHSAPRRTGTAPPAPRPKTLPTTFWASAATAVAAAGTASVFGVLALSSYGRAEDLCPSAPRDCNDEAIGLENRAHAQATVVNVSWAIAAVSAGLATYLFFDAKPAAQTARLTSFRGGAH